jgi:hypothetical protein
MELVPAAQLHSASLPFLAHCALLAQSADLLKRLELIIADWRALSFLFTKTDDSDEGHWSHRKEGREQQSDGPNKADGDLVTRRPIIRLCLRLWHRLGWHCKRNVLCRVILVSDLLDRLGGTILAFHSSMGNGDF